MYGNFTLTPLTFSRFAVATRGNPVERVLPDYLCVVPIGDNLVLIAAEALIADRDDAAIWQIVGLLHVGALRCSHHLCVIVEAIA